MDFDKIKEIFEEIIDYFKNFKDGAIYKFGETVVAFVQMIITIVFLWQVLQDSFATLPLFLH